MSSENVAVIGAGAAGLMAAAAAAEKGNKVTEQILEKKPDGEEFILDPDKTKSFINLRGELVPWGFMIDDEWHYSENNLFVKNLDLQFGYKQEKVNTDKIAIYSRKVEGGYGFKGRNTKPLTYYSYLPETEKRALIEYDGLPEWRVEKNYDLYLADYNVKFIRIDKQNTYIEMLPD